MPWRRHAPTVTTRKSCADNAGFRGYRPGVNYAEALNHLHSLKAFGFQPGLDNTRRLAAAVGNPEAGLRFIHVAGTNGKGSTCAFIESMQRAAGRRTGLYTSPHLVRFGERIQVDRQPIPDADLVRLVARLRDAAPKDFEPSFFEFTTIVALMWFAERKVDVVVWETGLGGRLDATNIVTPLASVITSIGLDHTQVLGPTIGDIAREKAGIIKPGVPVVTSAEAVDALAVIRHRARELDSPCLVVDRTASERLTTPVSLPGPHQRLNAATAAATCRLLRPILPCSDGQLAQGLAHTEWPARMQRIERDGRLWILDGAHNRDGVAVFRQALEEGFPGRRPTLVVAMLRDKAWREMLADLASVAGRFVVAPVNSPRTVSAEEMKEALKEAGCNRPIRTVASGAEALKAVSADPFVAFTGSLYFLGEILEQIEGKPTPDGDERGLNEWGGGVRGVR